MSTLAPLTVVLCLEINVCPFDAYLCIVALVCHVLSFMLNQMNVNKW
jgi:hypothetical protein